MEKHFLKPSRRISENPQSETRPHSSPDHSCGREGSRDRANPYPQTIVSPCRVHSDFFFGIFRKIHSNFV
jgi:hypothetical protein